MAITRFLTLLLQQVGVAELEKLMVHNLVVQVVVVVAMAVQMLQELLEQQIKATLVALLLDLSRVLLVVVELEALV
jgi:hypothetical protein